MQLIKELYQIGAIKFGDFTLKSGIQSPIYIDLRLVVSYPKLLEEIAEEMWETVASHSFDRVCGVPYTALPIATALSLKQNMPMVMRRKEAKNYGTKKIIEGVIKPGQNCLVVEDLVTSGLSVFETVAPLEEEGLKVTDIVVLLDRQQGGKKNIESKGYRLHSLFTLSEVLTTLQQDNCISPEIVQEVQTFIEANQC
ncbi:MAG: Orotate phosphoribosyltransferase [Chlamydiales bacterium]|nr:Orotate phosphoribosyltransferase [Chlamydiales bacterium]